MLKLEVTILVPVADNAGVPFDPAHHGRFEAELLALFGGFTRLPGTAEGQWADGGMAYADATRVYVVAVAGLVADGTKVAAAAEFLKAHYGQLAAYVRYLNVSETL